VAPPLPASEADWTAVTTLADARSAVRPPAPAAVTDVGDAPAFRTSIAAIEYRCAVGAVMPKEVDPAVETVCRQ
jgi:hypothetical protein